MDRARFFGSRFLPGSFLIRFFLVLDPVLYFMKLSLRSGMAGTSLQNLPELLTRLFNLSHPQKHVRLLQLLFHLRVAEPFPALSQ